MAPAEQTRSIARANAERDYSTAAIKASTTRSDKMANAAETFSTRMTPFAETLAKDRAKAYEKYEKTASAKLVTRREDDADAAEKRSKEVNVAEKARDLARTAADEAQAKANAGYNKTLAKAQAANYETHAKAIAVADEMHSTKVSQYTMARDIAITGARRDRDLANNNDTADLIADLADAESTFLSSAYSLAESLVPNLLAAQQSGVQALTSLVSQSVSSWATSEGTNYANFVAAQVNAAVAQVNATMSAELDLQEATTLAELGHQRAVQQADSNLETSNASADAAFFGLVISNLATFEITLAGLVHAFNIAETGAWKLAADMEAGAVKTWSESMADYAETLAFATISASASLANFEAGAAKTANDLIAAADKVYSNAMTQADLEFSETMLREGKAKADAYATANKLKDDAYTAAELAYALAITPFAITRTRELGDASIIRVSAIADAGVIYQNAVADAGVTFASAMVAPGVTLATDLAEAYKAYAVTMAEIGKDENVAGAELEKARISSLAASDPTFDYYSTYSSYYGGSGYGWYDDTQSLGSAWSSAFIDYVNPWNDSNSVPVDWIDYVLTYGTMGANITAVAAASSAGFIYTGGAVGTTALTRIGIANLPYYVPNTIYVNLSRFLFTRTGYKQVVSNSLFSQAIKQSGWQWHHWAISQATARAAGNAGLTRITHAGWNLVPIPNALNQSIGSSGLGFSAIRILVGSTPFTSAAGGYGLGQTLGQLIFGESSSED